MDLPAPFGLTRNSQFCLQPAAAAEVFELFVTRGILDGGGRTQDEGKELKWKCSTMGEQECRVKAMEGWN